MLLGREAALEARATTYIGDRRRRSRLFKYPLAASDLIYLLPKDIVQFLYWAIEDENIS